MITPEQLGHPLFRQRYRVRYTYAAGSMYKGISSTDLVIRMAQAGLLSFFGTGGLKLPVIRAAIEKIQTQLPNHQSFGMNLLCHLDQPAIEMEHVNLFIEKKIRVIEASAFMQMTPALVYYRLQGVTRDAVGTIHIPNQIIAKVSRPEVAKAFMSPAPSTIIKSLLSNGLLSEKEAQLSEYIPMAHEICVEADSAGHTDQGVAYVLMPTIKQLARQMMAVHRYQQALLIGTAGGIGTPEAASAAFLLGADFIMTGSINQCTVEAGTSDAVKDLLQQAEIQDMAYAPAGDMFEIGAKIQVLKRGLFFPTRANKLYELYQHYASIDDIDIKTQQLLQEKYFKKTFTEIWQETKSYYEDLNPDLITMAEQNQKHKMALIFKWYFIHTSRLALSGNEAQRVDFQIHCGPAQGAFNAWVKHTPLEAWQHRHVDQIAEKIMTESALYLSNYIKGLCGNNFFRCAQ